MIKIILASVLTIFSISTFAQLPTVNLKTLDGEVISSSTFENDGKPIIISFWATWCKPCKKELNNIMEVYEEWQEETGVKLIAISIDEQRFLPRVKPTVASSGWEFEVYSDVNQDFKRAMNVNNVPHTFLINGEGKIVYQHNNYSEGDEEELYDKILELVGE